MFSRRAACAVSLATFCACVIACGSGTEPTAPAVKDGPRVEGLRQRATIDGMTVTILAATIEPPLIETIGGGTAYAAEPYLCLGVVIGSADPAKKFAYTTWTGTDRHVTDDLGTKYGHVIFTTGRPSGRVVNGTAYSDKPLTDVLIIERPVPAAKYLDIDLPAPFDKSQVFRFRINTADITRVK